MAAVWGAAVAQAIHEAARGTADRFLTARTGGPDPISDIHGLEFVALKPPVRATTEATAAQQATDLAARRNP
jgi:hypothetical protein